MNADRVLEDLRELARLTGGPDGARRVCWTDEWTNAREFLRSRLDELPVEVKVDPAGNLWALLEGEADGFVIVGSHVDSVPAGGWLDGAFGIFTAVEALRSQAERGKPPVGLRLVDWADEEGARFGRSLFGSSSCSGTLDPDEVRDLRDRDGERLEDVLARYDVDLDRAHESGAELSGARAYIECHIEQGPVLESSGEPAATVLGTCGVERHVAVFSGQTAHAGATPMKLRHDTFMATSQAALAIRDVGIEHDGVCTVGGATSEPGVVTAVPGRTEMLLDQRHLDPDRLAAMLDGARSACEQAAADHGCEVELKPLWSIPPIPFDDRLIAFARQAVTDAGGTDTAIPSGPLHDAAEMARLIPTVMLFSSSSPPVSHTKEEDTPEADLRVTIDAYGRTVEATLAAAAAGDLPPRVRELQEQLAYLEASSAFYAERLRGLSVQGASDLPRLPFTTKEELREGQRGEPPFGLHLCAAPERLARMHVTSGTTGEPVAVGFTQADHLANSAVGGEAFRIAGVRADDTIAHCLNYALYAGGIADHMALEASGATVVPVGTGQSRRLLDLIPRLGINSIFGTLSFPAYLAGRAREAGIDPASLGLRHIVTAGEPGAGLAALRGEIEDAWGATVLDSFGMSDVWSTMGGACGEAEGLHLTTEGHAVLELVEPESGAPLELEDGASGEFVWTHLRREASPLLRYRSGDLGRVWTSPCACGRDSLRIRIDGRRDDMLRVQAVNVYPQAISTILSGHASLGRHCVVAEGDPVVPPLFVYVEAEEGVDLGPVTGELHDALRARFSVTRLEPGSLPVAEHKTRIVHRTARGDELPAAVATLRRKHT